MFESLQKSNADTKNIVSELSSGSIQVLSESRKLTQITQEIDSSIAEMAVGSEEIALALHGVNEISLQNKEQTVLLKREVDMFKV